MQTVAAPRGAGRCCCPSPPFPSPTPRRRMSRPNSITHHQFTGRRCQSVAFTATAATLPLTNDKGERQAGIFYVAYTRDGAESRAPADHLRVQRRSGLELGLSPSRRARAAHRAVRTGRADARCRRPSWSTIPTIGSTSPTSSSSIRSAPATAAPSATRASAIWGVSEDLDSLATFIDRYLTAAGRRASPKYLAGESYGGFRAARLPEVLADDHSIAIAGVFLISPVLEFSLIADDDLALLPDVLRLPSYAAVRLEQSGTLDARARWPRSSASPWVPISPRSPPRRATRLRCGRSIAEVARYTGVPEAVIAQHEGRLPLGAVRQGSTAAGQAPDQPLRRLGDRARSLSRLQPRARRCAVRRPAGGAGQRHAGLSRQLARACAPTCPTACPTTRSCGNGTGAAAWAAARAMPAPPTRCARCWPRTALQDRDRARHDRPRDALSSPAAT